MTITITPDALIRMTNIRKRFGPTVVLSDARLEVLPGEVHILAGENGAGKSTLIKILAGVYADWEGEIEYFGKPLRLHSTEQARRIGVSVIHQELSLVPGMTLAEDLFLGRQPDEVRLPAASRAASGGIQMARPGGTRREPRRCGWNNCRSLPSSCSKSQRRCLPMHA